MSVPATELRVGAAIWHRGGKANTLFRCADEALYAVKAAGCNRVCAAPLADAPGEEEGS